MHRWPRNPPLTSRETDWIAARKILHVSGFPRDYSARDLAHHFGRMGPLVRAHIPALERPAQIPYAYIEYSYCQDARAAFRHLHRSIMGGYMLNVEWARRYPREWREQERIAHHVQPRIAASDSIPGPTPSRSAEAIADRPRHDSSHSGDTTLVTAREASSPDKMDVDIKRRSRWDARAERRRDRSRSPVQRPSASTKDHPEPRPPRHQLPLKPVQPPPQRAPLHRRRSDDDVRYRSWAR